MSLRQTSDPAARRLALLSLAVAAACGDNARIALDPDAPPADAPPADTPPVPPDASPLDTLAGTGLCVDARCTQIAPGVREYAPRFQLWDDLAEKRRWIYLPPGTQIDTADMDRWVFPAGTKLWKEFTRDGVRVETRLLFKQTADDNAWLVATYQWNATNDGAVALTAGAQNANGTQHDIPTRSDCRACHERLRPSRVLGFGAIQLDYAAPGGLLDLEDLIAANLLTAPPTAAPSGAPPARFPLPGAAGDVAALGYLHANCGHCHNPTADVIQTSSMDLRLRTGALGSVEATPTYMTTVNVTTSLSYVEGGTLYTTLLTPRDPASSVLIRRMNTTNQSAFMPAIAVETVDPAGQAALTTWINSL